MSIFSEWTVFIFFYLFINTYYFAIAHARLATLYKPCFVCMYDIHIGVSFYEIPCIKIFFSSSFAEQACRGQQEVPHSYVPPELWTYKVCEPWIPPTAAILPEFPIIPSLITAAAIATINGISVLCKIYFFHLFLHNKSNPKLYTLFWLFCVLSFHIKGKAR